MFVPSFIQLSFSLAAVFFTASFVS
uniref:Uncharacterized protein n=1 Tax=Arundo donax TaxID=35708 RepID=A0A0A9H228_ARUDO